MSSTTWDDRLAAFDSYLESEERSPLTRQGYGDDLRAFSRWFKQAYQDTPELHDLVESELRGWKQSMIARNLKPNTINRRLRAFQSFLRWANDKGLAAPIKSPKAEKEEERRPHWLTRHEELGLMRAVEKAVKRKDRPLRDLAIVTVLLRTGLRVAELAALLWSDIAIAERKGSLLVRSGKGSKRRTVPLDTVARSALTALGYERNRGKPLPVFKGARGALTKRGVQGVIENLRIPAKLPELHAHQLRHTCLRRLIESGTSLPEAARIAGHSSTDTTALYVMPNDADLQAAVDRRAAAQYREPPQAD
jgi:integrase/recombinase XerC